MKVKIHFFKINNFEMYKCVTVKNFFFLGWGQKFLEEKIEYQKKNGKMYRVLVERTSVGRWHKKTCTKTFIIATMNDTRFPIRI